MCVRRCRGSATDEGRVPQVSNTSGEIVGAGKSLRHEVSELFGLRWEAAVEWVAIAWMSAWLWSFVLQGRWMPPGPLTWSADAIEAAGFGTPHWLVDTSEWLVSPDRSWIYWVLVAATVMASTASIGRRTGFRVTAVIAMALALEVETSWRTCTLIGFGVSALAMVAWIRVWQRGPVDRYWVQLVFSRQVVPLLVAPVIAPVLVLHALLGAYSRDDGDEPSIALAEEAVRAPRGSMGDGAGILPWADTMALVAAITSAHNPWIASRVASHFHFKLKQQREFAELSARNKRAFSSHGDHAFEDLLLKGDAES